MINEGFIYGSAYSGVQHILCFWFCFSSSCVASFSGLSFFKLADRYSPTFIWIIWYMHVQSNIMRQILFLSLLPKGQPGFVFITTHYEIQCK